MHEETQRYMDWVFPPAIVQQYEAKEYSQTLWRGQADTRTAWQKNIGFLARYLTRMEDEQYADLAARFTEPLNTKPDDNSAAESAVGYSLA